MAFKLFSASVLLFFGFALFARGDNNEGEEATPEEKITVEVLTPPPEDCERKSKRNDMLSMHYVGTLTESGTKFDSSHDRGQPFEFQLGAGQVIKGWEEGLNDMCVGEKRKLTIPASKGYGSSGAGDTIPPNAGLTFEVELLEIKDGEVPPNVFKEIDTNEDMFLSQEEVSSYLKRQADKAGDGGKEMMDQHNEIITQIFEHEDQDKDGLISHEEFSGPKHDEL
ncbi:peptidylprolyl isomerase [Plakobranchus ocellatus]|uniref:peptidylprolyl isomerase n=1 Tax=Plakobranchus ocellatus TaxID=259542 RepID=A0AAV4D2Z0_9GAST|nr:peptidylprolyl isomerase [Plakobranchus ocellatus]